MTKEGKILVFSLLFIIGFGGWYSFTKPGSIPDAPVRSQYSFSVQGEPIMLIDGKSEKESAPGSATKIITSYFGNEVKRDFNGDGKEDTAFLVTQSTGGSGTFFYLATTLGGEAMLLGDRISPQTTEFQDGKIVVNYAERKVGEPMTATPTMGVSKYFELKNGNLVEIKNTTAGESDKEVKKPTQPVSASPSKQCEQQGGIWSEQYKECTGIAEASCKTIGGTWSECASPCRHDSTAEVCNQPCVQVCTVK